VTSHAAGGERNDLTIRRAPSLKTRCASSMATRREGETDHLGDLAGAIPRPPRAPARNPRRRGIDGRPSEPPSPHAGRRFTSMIAGPYCKRRLLAYCGAESEDRRIRTRSHRTRPPLLWGPQRLFRVAAILKCRQEERRARLRARGVAAPPRRVCLVPQQRPKSSSRTSGPRPEAARRCRTTRAFGGEASTIGLRGVSIIRFARTARAPVSPAYFPVVAFFEWLRPTTIHLSRRPGEAGPDRHLRRRRAGRGPFFAPSRPRWSASAALAGGVSSTWALNGISMTNAACLSNARMRIPKSAPAALTLRSRIGRATASSSGAVNQAQLFRATRPTRSGRARRDGGKARSFLPLGRADASPSCSKLRWCDRPRCDASRPASGRRAAGAFLSHGTAVASCIRRPSGLSSNPSAPSMNGPPVPQTADQQRSGWRRMHRPGQHFGDEDADLAASLVVLIVICCGRSHSPHARRAHSRLPGARPVWPKPISNITRSGLRRRKHRVRGRAAS